jgi:hypothetical protein
MCCAFGPVSLVPTESGPVFMFCAPGLIFDGTGGVGSHFHVLRSRIYFGRYLGRRVLFSCFSHPDSLLAVLITSCPVFMFYAPGLIFGGTRGVGSRFSYFALPNPFLAVPRASGPVFMFFAHGPVFGSTDGVESGFHILRSRTHFRRYRGVGFLFMFCAPGPVFGGTDASGFSFHVLLSRTRSRRYRRRRVQFSCFTLPDQVSAVTTASGPIFMFCAPGHIFGSTEGVGSRFHVVRSRTRFPRYLRRRVPFSCFALPDQFLAVPTALGPVFMLCAPGPVFHGTYGVGSHFHVLRSRTSFRRYQRRQVPFSSFALPDLFLRY